MNKEFQYLANLATRYKEFAVDPAQLYSALSQLPEAIVEENFARYGDTTNVFQPVNLLRAEILRTLKKGAEIDSDVVENIKERIRQKETGSFSSLPQKYQKEFEDYRIGKRDIFANWQRPWSVLHPIVFSSEERRKTQLFLERIGKAAIKKLNIPDYTFHTVDFYGANNFGSDTAWLSIYPSKKSSHKQAYQFHLRINGNPEAGIMTGSAIEGTFIDKMARVNSFDDVLGEFRKHRKEIVKANDALRDYFKFSPGSKAYKWEEFKRSSIIALEYRDLDTGSLENFKNQSERNIAAGFEAEKDSNKTWNLWLFKSAQKGDVVFASKGRNACIGIGIVDGDYEFAPESDFQR